MGDRGGWNEARGLIILGILILSAFAQRLTDMNKKFNTVQGSRFFFARALFFSLFIFIFMFMPWWLSADCAGTLMSLLDLGCR